MPLFNFSNAWRFVPISKSNPVYAKALLAHPENLQEILDLASLGVYARDYPFKVRKTLGHVSKGSLESRVFQYIFNGIQPITRA